MDFADPARWKPLTTAADTVAAGIVAGRLRAEGIAVDVRMDTALLGEARLCRLYVPAEALRRAEGIISHSGFSDAELDALALSLAPPKE